MEGTIQYNSVCRRRRLAGFVRKMLFALVLEDAIVREENAYRFYDAALQRASGEGERRLLGKLCAEELRHRLELEELQSRGQTEELEFSSPEEVELLEPETRAWPEVPASSREILELALAKERQAASYYRLVGGRSVLRTVRDLFLMLAGQEMEHARWVEKMLAET